jgi:hypothetical protein
MKIEVEIYGKFIGDENLKDMIEKKECGVLLTFDSKDHMSRSRFVLTAEEAHHLRDQIDNAFAVSEKTGFKIV